MNTPQTTRRTQKTAAIRIALLVMAASWASAAPAQDGVSSGSPAITLKSGKLSMDGKSTLHPYTVTTQTLQIGSVVDSVASPADGGWPTLLRPRAVTSFEVRIPVRSLKSTKDGLNKNMYKALKADQHPNIEFRVADYAVASSVGEVTPITVKGTLVVAGIERETELALETQVTPEGLSVTGGKELLMTDFGIKPPSFMLGALKTDNKVVIRFSLLFTRSES